MHSVRLVTEDLYSVGASDHRLQMFENIHPLEGIGVSYNSYLLMDEKTVLFDGVDWAVCRQFLENVEFVLKDRPLDYFYVTHMEPDHAATMGEILLRHPETKILASEKAFQMMEQFGFGAEIEGRKEVVKDGGTFSFGKHEFAFLSAPMVHWPEVMMAFDTTNGVLFSSDAFGSFKSLDGALFNDEVNYDRDWIDESRRYYTNIVGKYGMNVQGVFKKLTPNLDNLKFICPIHGLVWRSDIDYILGKYDKWSKYEPEKDGVLIVYGSMYGNTESAAVALAGKLRDLGVKNVRVRDVSNTHVSWLIADTFEFSHVVLACVTYNLGIYPPMLNYLEDMKAITVRNRTYSVVGNGTWAPAVSKLLEEFMANELKGMEKLEETLTIKSSATQEDAQLIDRLAQSLADAVNKA